MSSDSNQSDYSDQSTASELSDDTGHSSESDDNLHQISDETSSAMETSSHSTRSDELIEISCDSETEDDSDCSIEGDNPDMMDVDNDIDRDPVVQNLAFYNYNPDVGSNYNKFISIFFNKLRIIEQLKSYI